MSEDVYGRYREALRLGHQHASDGKFKEALAQYSTAAALAPRALPHIGVGAMHMRLSQPREALTAYERALELEPENIDALSGRAAALLASGRRSEAAAIRDRIVALRARPEVQQPSSGAHSVVSGAEAQSMAGEEARVAGKTEAAIDAWLIEAGEHTRAGHYDAALDACLRALALDSGAMRTHLEMIRIYFARGWDDRAIQRTTLLDRVLMLTPDEALRSELDSLVQPRTPQERQPLPA